MRYVNKYVIGLSAFFLFSQTNGRSSIQLVMAVYPNVQGTFNFGSHQSDITLTS